MQLQQEAGENIETGFQSIGQSIGFGHEVVLGSESVVKGRKHEELTALRDSE